MAKLLNTTILILAAISTACGEYIQAPADVTRAGCVISDQDGKLLLTRNYHTFVHDVPAGCLDDGESAEEAAIRETKEETGYEVETTGTIGVFAKRVNQEIEGTTMLFHCKIVGGHEQITERATWRIEWMRPENVDAWRYPEQAKVFQALQPNQQEEHYAY